MAVTVTYENPVAGVTAPTAAQSLNTNRVTSNVIASADADTTATHTHNFALTAAQLAAGQPLTVLTMLLAAAQLSLWYASAQAANATTLTKATTMGSGNAGAQLRCSTLRHSILN